MSIGYLYTSTYIHPLQHHIHLPSKPFYIRHQALHVFISSAAIARPKTKTHWFAFVSVWEWSECIIRMLCFDKSKLLMPHCISVKMSWILLKCRIWRLNCATVVTQIQQTRLPYTCIYEPLNSCKHFQTLNRNLWNMFVINIASVFVFIGLNIVICCVHCSSHVKLHNMYFSRAAFDLNVTDVIWRHR